MVSKGLRVNEDSAGSCRGVSLLYLALVWGVEKVETLHKDANDFFLPNTSVIVHEAVLFDRVTQSYQLINHRYYCFSWQDSGIR